MLHLPAEADLAALSRPELEALFLAIERLQGAERLIDFIPRVSPSHPPPRHILPLVEAIERARWKPLRLCVHMPPRHAKTVTLLHALAWWVQNWPSDMNAYVSYNDTIALSKSRLCRNLAGQAGASLGGDSDAAGEWTTRQGGGVVAAGAGAGLTGRGFQGLVVVDDPYKNREEADSPVIKEKVWETFNEVVMTRLEGASVIVCHTRWSPDDLIGRLVGEKGWEYLNLAALAEAGDSLGREVGDPLWAENPEFSADRLKSIREQIGEWSFAALYQGHPRPRGHQVFGLEHYHDDNSFDGHRLVIYGDPAASKKTTADYGVMLAMAIKGAKEQQTGKVLDVIRRQMTVPEYCRALQTFQARWGNPATWVEAVGGFKAVPQMMIDVDPTLKGRLKEDLPEGDKFQRAQPVASAWNAGRVTILRGAPWVREFLAEVQSFTGVSDRQDGCVDCLSGAWKVGGTQPPSYSGSPSGFHFRR
jgi:predicted phage terminase large subunit-like protein